MWDVAKRIRPDTSTSRWRFCPNVSASKRAGTAHAGHRAVAESMTAAEGSRSRPALAGVLAQCVVQALGVSRRQRVSCCAWTVCPVRCADVTPWDRFAMPGSAAASSPCTARPNEVEDRLAISRRGHFSGRLGQGRGRE